MSRSSRLMPTKHRHLIGENGVDAEVVILELAVVVLDVKQVAASVLAANQGLLARGVAHHADDEILFGDGRDFPSSVTGFSVAAGHDGIQQTEFHEMALLRALIVMKLGASLPQELVAPEVRIVFR